MSNITVYHKDYCPYCRAAKKLLKSQGLKFKEIEVTSNAVEFSNMVRLSKRRTVPQIFVGKTHVGGFDDLKVRFSQKKAPFESVDRTQ